MLLHIIETPRADSAGCLFCQEELQTSLSGDHHGYKNNSSLLNTAARRDSALFVLPERREGEPKSNLSCKRCAGDKATDKPQQEQAGGFQKPPRTPQRRGLSDLVLLQSSSVFFSLASRRRKTNTRRAGGFCPS